MNQSQQRSIESPNEQSWYELDLHLAKTENDRRFKTCLDSIYKKYGQDFGDSCDEIDLKTGQIVIDNGHLGQINNGACIGTSVWNPFMTKDKHVTRNVDLAHLIADDDSSQSLGSSPITKVFRGTKRREADAGDWDQIHDGPRIFLPILHRGRKTELTASGGRSDVQPSGRFLSYVVPPRSVRGDSKARNPKASTQLIPKPETNHTLGSEKLHAHPSRAKSRKVGFGTHKPGGNRRCPEFRNSTTGGSCLSDSDSDDPLQSAALGFKGQARAHCRSKNQLIRDTGTRPNSGVRSRPHPGKSQLDHSQLGLDTLLDDPMATSDCYNSSECIRRSEPNSSPEPALGEPMTIGPLHTDEMGNIVKLRELERKTWLEISAIMPHRNISLLKHWYYKYRHEGMRISLDYGTENGHVAHSSIEQPKTTIPPSGSPNKSLFCTDPEPNLVCAEKPDTRRQSAIEVSKSLKTGKYARSEAERRSKRVTKSESPDPLAE